MINQWEWVSGTESDRSIHSISESSRLLITYGMKLKVHTIFHSDHHHAIKSVSNSIWETQSSLLYTYVSELFSQCHTSTLNPFVPSQLSCQVRSTVAASLFYYGTLDADSPVWRETFVGSRQEMLFGRLLPEWTWLWYYGYVCGWTSTIAL